MLFHYNGHGVPRPTANGEVWVFNKSYTQYIPLSVFDLQVSRPIRASRHQCSCTSPQSSGVWPTVVSACCLYRAR